MITKAEIKFIKSLGASRSERRSNGLFIAEGDKIIADFLAAGLTTQAIYRVGDNISSSDLNRISFLKTPTTALALFHIPTYNFERSPIALALDGVQDPGNIGTIVRTADWFGINTIYCSNDSADVFAPKVVQSTMGSLSRVKVEYTDLGNLLSGSKEPIYGTFLENASNIYSEPRPEKAIIVMGNEGNGISPAVEALVSRRIYIARIGGGESLNVAIATAIAMSTLTKE